MKKDLVIIANTSDPLGKFYCDKCGNTTIATKNVINSCTFCGQQFDSEASDVSAKVTASLSNEDSFDVVCEDCSASLRVCNSDNDAVDFSLARFCPVCGGCNMSSADEVDDNFTPSACKDGSCDELKAEDEEAYNNDESVANLNEAKQESIESTEEDIRSTLNNETPSDNEITEDSLQWKAVDDDENGKNGTLVAFSAATGNPLFIFRRKDCSSDLKDIFATSIMIQAFNQVAKKDGIGTAVSKFGGKTYNTKEVLKSNYINSLVDAKINNEVIPRFIECMALVVDGAVKGVYADVRQDINDSMANDLIGAGLPKERVEAAISSTFGSGGTTVFSSILAKAIQLMKKNTEAYNEAKSMIASAQMPQSELNLKDNVEQQRIRETLNANTGIILGSTAPHSFGSDTSAPFSYDSDIMSLRERLGFGKKSR